MSGFRPWHVRVCVWCVAGVVERIVGVLVLARSAWETQPKPAARKGKRPCTTAASGPEPGVAGHHTRRSQPGVARNTHHHRQQNPARSGGETHSGTSARSREEPPSTHTSHTHTCTTSKPQPGKPTATRHTRTNTHGRHTHTHTTTINTERTHQRAPRHKHTQHGKPPTEPRGSGHHRGRQTQARSGGELHPGPSARSGEGEAVRGRWVVPLRWSPS